MSSMTIQLDVPELPLTAEDKADILVRAALAIMAVFDDLETKIPAEILSQPYMPTCGNPKCPSCKDRIAAERAAAN